MSNITGSTSLHEQDKSNVVPASTISELSKLSDFDSPSTTSPSLADSEPIHVHRGVYLNSDPSEKYIDLTHAVPSSSESNIWYKVNNFLWDSVSKHPSERQFLLKLDWFLLSSACAGYFLKTLDTNNIGTAYVNGMKEHYSMHGNEYNYMTTLWTVGYIVGQIPSNLILHRISARYYLAGLEFLWAILTVLLITPKTLSQFYAIRFFLGLTESGYFPGLEYLLGSWYSREELTKRSTFFSCAGTAAGLISGPVQSAILKSSWANRGHLKPFQWMFVIDAAIGVPIALYTLFTDPNTPSTTTAWYFSETDVRVALERRRRIGAQLNTREKYSIKKVKSFFSTWHIYVFPLLFLAVNNSYQPVASQAFQQWMKIDLHLTQSQYNIYPIIMSAGGIGLSLVMAYFNDYFQGKYNGASLAFMFCGLILTNASLAAWNIPVGYHWFCYYAMGIFLGVGQAMAFSWINRCLAHDDMKRNFVVVITNTTAYVTGAWVPLLTFNQDQAPRFHTGFTYTACLCSAGLIFTGITEYLINRDEKVFERGLVARDGEQDSEEA